MNRTFISTRVNGLARGEYRNGRWSIEILLEDARVHCLALDPLNPAQVYAGTQASGLLRSLDGGKTWVSAGLEDRVIKAVALSAAEPGLMVVGTRPAGILISRDAGKTWEESVSFAKTKRWFWFSPVDKPFTAYVQGIALSPTDPDMMIAGIEAGSVVRSADGGATWQDHRKGALRDCHAIQFHPTNGDWVYEGGGTGAGAAFSRDAGDTWTQSKKGTDRTYGWAMTGDPARPEVMYVSLSPSPLQAHSENNAQAYIFRSVDGDGWQKLGGGLPQPLNYMPYALLTDDEAPGHLYAGLSNGDIWHSTNYGDDWQQLPVNMGSVFRSMVILQS